MVHIRPAPTGRKQPAFGAVEEMYLRAL